MPNLNGFNAAEVEPIGVFEPLPPGKYVAIITKSEMRPTKSGQGSYLQLAFTIAEGAHKNRVLWVRLNLAHPNAQAVKIARSQLSAICRAVGVMQPRDSVELHEIPLVITVALRPREDTGELANVVKGYERKEPARYGCQAPVTDNTPPWKR